VLSLLVLLTTGVLGMINGVTQPGEADDMLQFTVACGVLAYGVLGIVTAYGMLRRKRWAVPVGVVWGIIITYVASMATFAYAPEEATAVAAIAGGLGTALIAYGVVRTIRVSLARASSGRSD